MKARLVESFNNETIDPMNAYNLNMLINKACDKIEEAIALNNIEEQNLQDLYDGKYNHEIREWCEWPQEKDNKQDIYNDIIDKALLAIKDEYNNKSELEKLTNKAYYNLLVNTKYDIDILLDGVVSFYEIRDYLGWPDGDDDIYDDAIDAALDRIVAEQ